jgi:hypothetical protein
LRERAKASKFQGTYPTWIHSFFFRFPSFLLFWCVVQIPTTVYREIGGTVAIIVGSSSLFKYTVPLNIIQSRSSRFKLVHIFHGFCFFIGISFTISHLRKTPSAIDHSYIKLQFWDLYCILYGEEIKLSKLRPTNHPSYIRTQSSLLFKLVST